MQLAASSLQVAATLAPDSSSSLPFHVVRPGDARHAGAQDGGTKPADREKEVGRAGDEQFRRSAGDERDHRTRGEDAASPGHSAGGSGDDKRG